MKTETKYRADELVVRSMRVRFANTEKRFVDVVASTSAEDSYGDIVEQSWLLDRYRDNPVVLYAHNSRELPIGKANDVRVENGQLVASLQFATGDANPRAEQVWQLIQQGVLRSVSVGFDPRDVRLEMRDGREFFVLSNNELYEISVVPIPANPEAMIRMRQRAAGVKQAAPAAPPLKGKTMNTVLTELGLTESDGEPEAVQLIRALRARVSNHDDVLEFLSLSGCTDREQVLSVLKAYKDAAERVPTLEAQIETLTKSAEKAQRDSLVERIMIAKKATVHQRNHFLPTQSIEQLRMILETGPRIEPLSGKVQEPSPETAKELDANRWKAMPGEQKAKLLREQPEVYAQLKTAAGE